MQTIRRSALQSISQLQLRSLVDKAIGGLVAPKDATDQTPSRVLGHCVQTCSFKTVSHSRAGGLGGLSSGPAEIFDRELKKAHRDRAAWLQKKEDPLQVEVAERLLDRLEDCKRTFPVVAVLGGSGGAVLQRLRGGRAGIEKILYLDSSRDMLALVKQQQLALQGESDTPAPHISYVQGDEEMLPLRQHSVDLIISDLGLHWVNDLPGAMIQCRQALKPDGLFLSAFWGGDTLQELRIAYALAEQEVEGGLSARVSPLAQVRDAGNLLTRAGFSIPSVDTDEITVQYSSTVDLYHHIRSMGESNAVRIRRPMVRHATAKRAAEIYAEKFGSEDGSLPATYQVIFMTGWSPHDRQQQALPRGSATKSFEDLQAMIERQKKGE